MLVALGAAGCAGEKSETAPDAALAETADLPPSDFTFAFTVVHQTSKRNVASIPRDRRPMRFLMETDWVLRAFAGPNLTDQSFPREARQLTHQQVEQIWHDLRSAGLLDLDHPSAVGSVPPPEQWTVTDGSAWVLTIKANGDRRVLLLQPEQHASAAPVLDRLADLAWMPE